MRTLVRALLFCLVALTAAYAPSFTVVDYGLVQAQDKSFTFQIAELIKTKIAYQFARQHYETLKSLKGEERLRAIYGITDFSDKPLSETREAFVTAKHNLETALSSATDEEKKGTEYTYANTQLASQTKGIVAEPISAQVVADKSLVSEAFQNLAAALDDAFFAQLVEKPEVKDECRMILALLQKAAASQQTLSKLTGLAELIKAQNATVGTNVKGALATLAGWSADFQTLQLKASKNLEGDLTKLTDLIVAINESNVKEKNTNNVDEKATEKDREKKVAELAVLVAVATQDREIAILTAKELEAAGSLFKGLKPTAAALRVSAEALRPVLEVAQDRVGGDRKNWQQQAIPIFYFGSVPRLMAALNINAERFESSFFRDIDSGRRALLDTEKLRDIKRAEANRLISEIGLSRQNIAAINAKIKLNEANATQLGLESERIQKRIDKLGANDPQRAILTAQKSKVDVDKGVAETAADKSKQERQDAETEKATLEAQATKAAQDLSEVRKSLNQMQLELAITAEEEVKAFRAKVQQAPFWISRSLGSSTDPVKRCEIFGYEDSLVIFVRGESDDIKKVADIVRSFDRPTPQARLTLHTLQFNGSNPVAMRMATEEVERVTTELRGNMTLVQNALRNAVSKEVNRHARVAQDSILLPSNSSFKEWVYRGFYYPREVREQLGLRLRLPVVENKYDYVNNLCTVRDDLQTIQALVKLAGARLRGIRELNDGSAKMRLMSEIELGLTHAEYLFGKLEFSQPDILQFLKANSAQDLKTVSDKARVLRKAFRGSDSYQVRLNAILPVLSMDPCKECQKDSTKQATCKEPNCGPTLPYDKVLSALKNLEDKIFLEILMKREVVKQLDQEAVYRINFLTGYTLPDPSRGTTLGELLFIFSLGNQESRERILHDFSSELLDEVRGMFAEKSPKEFENFVEEAVNMIDGQSYSLKGSERKAAGLAALAVSSARIYGNASENLLDVKANSLFPYFPRTVFGSFSPRTNPGPSREPMTANQLEVLSAIRARVRGAVLAELRARVQTSGDIIADDRERQQFAVLANFLQDDAFNTSDQSNAIFDSFDKGFDIHATNISSQINSKVPWSLLDSAEFESAGRIAAADDMIKRFITVLEDDLEHFLVAPTKQVIREKVSQKGVEFGSFQSISLLTSNRGAARFDSSAIATLGQDPEAAEQALLVGQQLGDLANVLGGSLGKASGIAPFALPAVRATTHQGTPENQLWKLSALGVLGGALFLPETNPKATALYSLTSGSQFLVTPILDPSGQALRFDLDYSLSTRIQEPSNTRGIEIPRVERQSMNIPVQVSNMDFRRVAEFETNTKIGVTPQYFGGLPFFKQLPIFKDIPLIGYFAKSNGTPQVRQQTYVFVQSSIYPTVSDILGVLVDAPLRGSRAPSHTAGQQTPKAN